MASAFKDRIPNGMDAVNLAMQAAAGLSSGWVALWLYIAMGYTPEIQHGYQEWWVGIHIFPFKNGDFWVSDMLKIQGCKLYPIWLHKKSWLRATAACFF